MNNGPAEATSSPSAKPIAEYAVGDVVRGTVRGYPPWPCMVEDPDEVPGPVLDERPREWESSLSRVVFFSKADCAWLPAASLSPLLPNEIEAFLADDSNKHKRRKEELTGAYEVARDPLGWIGEVRGAWVRLVRKFEELEAYYAGVQDESDEEEEEEEEGDQLEDESEESEAGGGPDWWEGSRVGSIEEAQARFGCVGTGTSEGEDEGGVGDEA